MRVTGKEPWLKALDSVELRGVAIKALGPRRKPRNFGRIGKHQKRVKVPQPPSEHEELYWLLLKQQNLQDRFVRQHRWCPGRQWSADFADKELKILVEIDGGTWMRRSRHGSGPGYALDRVKDMEAQLSGWLMLRFAGEQVENGCAMEFTLRALNARSKALAERCTANLLDYEVP